MFCFKGVFLAFSLFSMRSKNEKEETNPRKKINKSKSETSW